MALPFLLVGDGPGLTSGLGRIAAHLLAQLWDHRATLGIDPAHFALDVPPGVPRPWPVYGSTVAEEASWGVASLRKAIESHIGDRPGVIFTVWDPSRCAAFLEVIAAYPQVRWWGYPAIDGHNPQQRIDGPARAMLGHYDRVLAYGRYGARVLEATLGRPIPSLPHGILPEVFTPVGERASALSGYETVVGCVAANQPRKDLALLFAAHRLIADEIPGARLWLHTDQWVAKAWSIPELVDRFELQRQVIVSTEVGDLDLAAHYRACAVTIAPGLGEGFGYPIVESLACGVPVVHGTYGGGTELVPHPAWRFPQQAQRWEGAYCIERPVYTPRDVANAALRALRWKTSHPALVRTYCTASVAYLAWEVLWPRWAAWVAEGVREMGLR
jgi:glycosyltransferase involved in cell wall biosynthesis